MWNERTVRLIGSEGVKQLDDAHVLVVGIGGVGASCVEALARAGVGKLTLVDSDCYEQSNINRQLYATIESLGVEKVEVAKERVGQINPSCQVVTIKSYLSTQNIAELFDDHTFDFVVDAIDTLQPKVALLAYFYRRNIGIVSAMGAGGRLDPSKIQIADISKTKDCMLAKNVRKRLAKQGIYRRLPCVFSTELVDKNLVETTNGDNNKKSIVGTISYMPMLFGQMVASVVIREVIKKAS